MTMFIGVMTYFVISLCNQYLLPNLYNDSFNDILLYVPLIALAYLVFPYYLKANYILTYNKKTKPIALISVFSSILNIGLNIILIPFYGIYAAVIITIFSFMVQSMIFTIISNREKRFSKETFSLLIFILIIIFTIYFELPYYLSTVFSYYLLLLIQKINLKCISIMVKKIIPIIIYVILFITLMILALEELAEYLPMPIYIFLSLIHIFIFLSIFSHYYLYLFYLDS